MTFLARLCDGVGLRHVIVAHVGVVGDVVSLYCPRCGRHVTTVTVELVPGRDVNGPFAAKGFRFRDFVALVPPHARHKSQPTRWAEQRRQKNRRPRAERVAELLNLLAVVDAEDPRS